MSTLGLFLPLPRPVDSSSNPNVNPLILSTNTKPLTVAGYEGRYEASIKTRDLGATNGVVHTIDSVLRQANHLYFRVRKKSDVFSRRVWAID